LPNLSPSEAGSRRPRVSICIPSYNRATFIRRTLEAALQQAVDDMEIVVLDDGSTDGTLEVAESYRDPRLRVVRADRHYGLGANFNRCLEVARGAYVKILCDDDLLYPNAIDRLADGLDRFPDASFATSAWDLLDEGGSVRMTARLVKRAPEDGVLVGLREIVRSSWLFRNRIGNPSSILLRRAALGELRFNTEYRQMMDWELWLRLLKRGPLLYVPQVLSANQLHSGAVSVKQEPLAQTASDLLAVSCELAASRAEYSGAITKWDIKRLQALCSLSALETAFRNIRRRHWRLAVQNARFALRALRIFFAVG